MQIAVIEFARSVLGVQDASNTEFDKDSKSPYVIFMPEGSKTHMGGTMRLGSRRTYFHVNGCRSAKLYGNASFVEERHRHRYEVNPDMVAQLENNAGMSFTGKDESGERMEIVELPDHPFFIGSQFHPEFKSRPGNPSPLFIGLIAAAVGELDAISGSLAIVHDPLLAERPKYNYTLPAPRFDNISFKDYDKHCYGSIYLDYPNDDRIPKDRANGTLNGVYSDRINVVFSNGNGLLG